MRCVTWWLSLVALAAISLATLAGCAQGKTQPPGISGNPLPSTTTTTPSS